MKRLSLLVAAAAIAAGTAAGAQAAAPLLTPAELNGARTDASVRIIDIRPPQEYAANHIPGAVSAPYAQWRGPADNPGQLPPVGKLSELVRSLGLDKNVHAVVVSSGANDTDFGLSAGIVTTSLKYATHFKRHSEAGMVMVNVPTAGVDFHVPFGGRKGSSYGPREQGKYAAEFFTIVKTAYTAAG